MQISRSTFLAAFLAIAIISSCKRPDLPTEQDTQVERDSREESSAKSSEHTRQVGDFQAVELRGAAELIVNIGSPTSVVLDANEKTLKHVETEVTGDKLVIDVAKSRGWFTDHGHLKIIITTPKLTSLESNGAGEINIRGLDGGDHVLRVAGAHEVNAEGRVDNLTIELSGAGQVDYRNVVAGDAKVTVNGAGDVNVQATKSLRAEVNGVGAVHYSGEPQKVESELHGLGSIGRR
jgi:hypothetical protein